MKASKGDLVACRIERQKPYLAGWQFQEVLAVDLQTGEVTHICTIGNPDQETPDVRNSIVARSVDRWEHIPKEPAPPSGAATAYTLSLHLAEEKNFYSDAEFEIILMALQVFKTLRSNPS